jgi:hypothetical protein
VHRTANDSGGLIRIARELSSPPAQGSLSPATPTSHAATRDLNRIIC